MTKSLISKSTGPRSRSTWTRAMRESRGRWKKGRRRSSSFLPMPVRRVVAHAAVKEDAGKVALQRGPIVFCAEGIDNGGKALNLALPTRPYFTAEFRPDLLKGVVVLKGKR